MKLLKATLDNLDILKEYISESSILDCAFCPGNMVLWSDFYHARYFISENMLTILTEEDGQPSSFTFPIGKGMDYEKDINNISYQTNAKKAFDRICSYFRENGIQIKIHCATPAIYELINSWYPGEFSYTPDRDSYDYIYSVEKLAKLSGSKLHGKRGHINNFIKNHPDYIYEDVNEQNSNDCLQILKAWMDKHKEVSEEVFEEYMYEYRIIEKSLANMKRLNMKGGLIKAGGVPVAFTLGEPINNRVYDIHFEKADESVQGAYQIINREFVSRNLMDYSYVNREEDLGIEGLRKSKLSYYPDILYEKGIINQIHF